MEIEPINQGLLDRPTRSLFYPTTPMNSPAPNIPGAISAMHPFTEYMNELELEASSEDDIRAGDETLDAIFAEDHALGVGGGAALAGCTPATPQEGGDLAMARAMAALSFVDIDQKPPANEGKHAPLKKTPCQSIISCDDTGIFLKKAPIVTKKERKKMLYKNSANLPKVSLIVAFFLYTHTATI
jgi:hypothetical protein